jgi:hypothetical protein
MEIVLERRTGDPLMALYREIDQSTLRAALEDCREFEQLEIMGFRMNCAPVTPGCAGIYRPSWNCLSRPNEVRSGCWLPSS